MSTSEAFENVKKIIIKSREFSKCRKCECMKESLESIKNALSNNKENNTLKLLKEVEKSLDKFENIEYAWLGCKHCWSADVTNAFDDVFSGLDNIHSIETPDNNYDNILPAVGEYHVLSLGYKYPIAISTLGNAELADKISKVRPNGLSIVGKTETENIGVEKIIKNVTATPSIKYIILCGNDSVGHYSGDTLISLMNNGVDSNMRVLNCKGRRPVLSNTTLEEINIFRNQIEIINMIGCEDLDIILNKIAELLNNHSLDCSCNEKQLIVNSKSMEIVNVIEKDPNKVKLDKAGYFVIVPKPKANEILVEHYSNDNKSLRIIKGDNARDIYWSIIENERVTELSHSAYLGKELTKAEMSMELGFKYIQDKA